MHTSSALALLTFAALVPAQARIFIGGVPSNLWLDLSSTAVVLDPAASDAFYALMPFTNGQVSFNFAVFEDVSTMNLSYGAGNWLRCTMVATHWAYLSNDACAHQPAPGTAAPQSMLWSDHDYGFDPGIPGTPNQPWPGATLFSGSTWSVIRGLSPPPPFPGPERWQLRTRGFLTTDRWNACPPGTSIGPNFTGWLLARFTFSFT